MLLFEPEVFRVFGGGSPLFVEGFRGPLLLRVEGFSGLALAPALVFRVASGACAAHLKELPRNVHPDEVLLISVLDELLVDGLRGLFRRLFVLESPQRQQLALVRLRVENALLAASNLIRLGMLAQIYAVVRIFRRERTPATMSWRPPKTGTPERRRSEETGVV